MDPSTVAFGLALVRLPDQHRPIGLEFFSVIRPAGKDRAERLGDIANRLHLVLGKLSLQPTSCTAVVEGGYVGTNGQSSLAIAEARGVGVSVCASRGLKVATVSPASGKIAAAGKGNADKDAVMTGVAMILGHDLEAEPLPHDASDAAAVALAGAQEAGFWSRPPRMEVGLPRRRRKRAASVAEFLGEATRRFNQEATR